MLLDPKIAPFAVTLLRVALGALQASSLTEPLTVAHLAKLDALPDYHA